jgi:hypothetical protein
MFFPWKLLQNCQIIGSTPIKLDGTAICIHISQKKTHGRITIFITIGSSFIFPIPWKFPSAAPTFLRPRDEFLADLPARSRVHRRHGG